MKSRAERGTDRFGALDLGALAAATSGLLALLAAPSAAPALFAAAVVLAAGGAAGPLAPLAAAVLPLPIDQRAMVAAAALAAVVALRVRAGHVGLLEYAARIDQLTGLYRYEAFAEAASLELERATRYGDRVCLIVFDLDRFKPLNDRYGHAVGNVVLEECGQVLRETLRNTDIAGRFGGEELVALVRGDSRKAHVAAERVRYAVSTIAVDTPHGPARVTLSAGIAHAGAGTDLDTLFAAADAALYEAKRRGRNRTVLATAEMVRAA